MANAICPQRSISLKTNKKEKADIGLSAFLSQKGHKDGLKKALYLRKKQGKLFEFLSFT
jgi:hypothetical protein